MATYESMELLKGYSDAEVRKLADEATPQPMAGAWTLTAPDGRAWTANGPLRCVSAEINDRVPPLVALARIRRGLAQDAASLTTLLPLPEGHEPMPANWWVEVSADGEQVLWISSNAVTGNMDGRENVVIGAARHLLAFVGYGLPASEFDPEGSVVGERHA